MLCSLFMSGYEVVNADSVQVYRKLDIGSAKADSRTLQTIRHHLIDIRDPWESWNVASFIEEADRAIEDIRSRGRIPVICGGTAFYFKNFLYGLSEAPKSDPEIREEVRLFMQSHDRDVSHALLSVFDPVSANRININDTYRVSRALEVYKTSGRPLSGYALPTSYRKDFDVLILGLTRDKDELRRRIERRVDIMFEQGMAQEIRSLISEGATSRWQSMQAIGYKQFFDELENSDFEHLDIQKIRNQIVMDSIHYAKRQMTFFRSFDDVHWVNPDDTQTIRMLLSTFENS